MAINKEFNYDFIDLILIKDFMGLSDEDLAVEAFVVHAYEILKRPEELLGEIRRSGGYV